MFKLDFLDVLPVQALSNVKKSNLEFKSFPVRHLFHGHRINISRDMDVKVFPGMQKAQNFRQP